MRLVGRSSPCPYAGPVEMASKPPLEIDMRSTYMAEAVVDLHASGFFISRKFLEAILSKESEVKIVNGIEKWYSNNRLHRNDGPAILDKDGNKVWMSHGRRHRVDGPAVELSNGTRAWFSRGRLHRKDGPAIERHDGRLEWYQRGERHREDGPAIELAGDKFEYEWWQNGKRHRIGGPAVLSFDPNQSCSVMPQWHLDGFEYLGYGEEWYRVDAYGSDNCRESVAFSISDIARYFSVQEDFLKWSSEIEGIESVQDMAKLLYPSDPLLQAHFTLKY